MYDRELYSLRLETIFSRRFFSRRFFPRRFFSRRFLLNRFFSRRFLLNRFFSRRFFTRQFLSKQFFSRRFFSRWFFSRRFLSNRLFSRRFFSTLSNCVGNWWVRICPTTLDFYQLRWNIHLSNYVGTFPTTLEFEEVVPRRTTTTFRLIGPRKRS